MSEQTPAPDVNEREALKDLVESDGWQLFLSAVHAEWGPAAQLAQIDRALQDLPPGDQDAVNMQVQQIRSAANAITNALRWPTLRLAQLKKQQESKGFGFRRRA